MLVPFDRLDTLTLQRVIEEFISREGTDYGLQNWDLASKVEEVLRQLKKGEVVLCFDEVSETCQILARDNWRAISNIPRKQLDSIKSSELRP